MLAEKHGYAGALPEETDEDRKQIAEHYARFVAMSRAVPPKKTN